ncbi:hypothetical protein ANN_11037 [Periplaneta americana]|uniref:Uncharacterized protein n=1 Tax=Periplaneta americana TaxID=6978 RepID=A0ABQ8T542_PERAM|nr:hypothetical protein ANN_11037 [Periplaneta americana]
MKAHERCDLDVKLLVSCTVLGNIDRSEFGNLLELFKSGVVDNRNYWSITQETLVKVFANKCKRVELPASVMTVSLMLAGNEFQSLGRAIVKEDEYEEVRWDGIVSTVSWRERVFRLWWEERPLAQHGLNVNRRRQHATVSPYSLEGKEK